MDLDDFVNRVKTEGIEVEYLMLPITGLSFDCMIRMSKPFATVLDKDIVSIPVSLSSAKQQNYTELLKQECSNRYTKMMRESELDIDGDIPVKLIELDLVRK